MKKIFILSSLIAVTLATTSFAEPTELDKKTVASKAYVDTKQDKIPAQDTNLVPGQQVVNNVPSSVIAPTTAGNVTQVALWDADGRDMSAWDIDEYFSDNGGYTGAQRDAIRESIPTVAAIEAGLETRQRKMTCAGWDSDTHTDEHCWLWSIAE